MIRCRALWSILAASLVIGHATASDSQLRVMAHYMPWFGMEEMADGSMRWEHWYWHGNGPKHDPNTILPNGRRDISSVFYPLIGPYDGRDEAVLEYHFLTAKACGIEGFIADWYGGGFSDAVFGEMVSAAERYDMKVAICLEEKTFFSGYTNISSRAGAVDEAERQIRLVLDTHVRSPSYWRIDGKPVVLIFLGHAEDHLGRQILSPEELAQVLDRIGPPGIHFIRPNVDPDYNHLVQGGYAWIGGTRYRDWFYPTATDLRNAGTWETVIGAVNPGFDDTGVWGWGNGVRTVDRRGVAEYEANWEYILRYSPDIVQITTWNDFEEGTTIEPTEEYGFDFVNLTEQFVGEWTARKSRLNDNQFLTVSMALETHSKRRRTLRPGKSCPCKWIAGPPHSAKDDAGGWSGGSNG